MSFRLIIPIILLISGFLFFQFQGEEPVSLDLPVSSSASIAWAMKNSVVDSPFPLVAKSGIIINKRTGQALIERYPDRVLPIASLSKVMTAIVLLESGESFDKDTFYKMMLRSSNRAAEKLAVSLVKPGLKPDLTGAVKPGFTKEFVDKMNEKAREIGLRKTSFQDVKGLSPENKSTAREIARLFQYVIENHPFLLEVMGTSSYKNWENRNKLLAEPNVLAGKTGFTDEAGGCLGLITDKYISVVLGAKDQEARFEQSRKLISNF